MERTYKITKITETGSCFLLTQVFHNSLGALENAITFNMMLQGVGNIVDPALRKRYHYGVIPSRSISPRETAYVQYGSDMYCISEVFESEMPKLILELDAMTHLN